MVPFLLISALAWPSPPTDVTSQQAVARADLFRVASAKAGGLSIIGPAPSGQSTTPVQDDAALGAFDIWYLDGLVTVLKSNGNIRSFERHFDAASLASFPGSWDAANALGDAALATITTGYYNSAGYAGQLTVRGKDSVTGYDNKPPSWSLMAIRHLGNLEYHMSYDVDLEVEHTTGVLLYMSVPALPAAPIAVEPEVESDYALAQTALMINDARGSDAFAIREPERPVVWCPSQGALDNDMNRLGSSDAALAAQFRGKLIYWCELESADEGHPGSWYGFADAVSGSAMGAGQSSATLGSNNQRPRPKVTLAGLSGDIAVAGRKAKAEVKLAPAKGVKISAVSNSKTGRTGAPVVLMTRKSVMVAKYDSSRNLLFVGGKCGRPNESLIRALRSVSPLARAKR